MKANILPGATIFYAERYAPFDELLRRLKLPKRGKPGSLRNFRRMQRVNIALHRLAVKRRKEAAAHGARAKRA